MKKTFTPLLEYQHFYLDHKTGFRRLGMNELINPILMAASRARPTSPRRYRASLGKSND